MYVESMLRLESGAIGEFVSGRILMALVDMLIELDVSSNYKLWMEILSFLCGWILINKS